MTEDRQEDKKRERGEGAKIARSKSDSKANVSLLLEVINHFFVIPHEMRDPKRKYGEIWFGDTGYFASQNSGMTEKNKIPV